MAIQTYGLSEDELMHYGVLGMKCGHRKAVNSYMTFRDIVTLMTDLKLKLQKRKKKKK